MCDCVASMGVRALVHKCAHAWGVWVCLCACKYRILVRKLVSIDCLDFMASLVSVVLYFCLSTSWQTIKWRLHLKMAWTEFLLPRAFISHIFESRKFLAFKITKYLRNNLRQQRFDDTLFSLVHVFKAGVFSCARVLTSYVLVHTCSTSLCLCILMVPYWYVPVVFLFLFSCQFWYINWCSTGCRILSIQFSSICVLTFEA